MATELRDPAEVDLSLSQRALVLVWQNPTTRRFVKVGRIDALPEGRFSFHYLSSADDDPDFRVLDEFPRRESVYVSDELPAFFANRVLTPDRPGYGEYLDWLGISTIARDDVPFEVLARTGGGRATDTFHVVDLPTSEVGFFSSRFFVSGVRYADEAGVTVAGIRPGAMLALEMEPSNTLNRRAVLVNTADGRRVGYVPDWLCGEVHDVLVAGWTVAVVAEQVNADAPAHVRVLCRIDANR